MTAEDLVLIYKHAKPDLVADRRGPTPEEQAGNLLVLSGLDVRKALAMVNDVKKMLGRSKFRASVFSGAENLLRALSVGEN